MSGAESKYNELKRAGCGLWETLRGDGRARAPCPWPVRRRLCVFYTVSSRVPVACMCTVSLYTKLVFGTS